MCGEDFRHLLVRILILFPNVSLPILLLLLLTCTDCFITSQPAKARGSRATSFYPPAALWWWLPCCKFHRNVLAEWGMAPEPYCSSRHWKAALEIPSLACALGEDNAASHMYFEIRRWAGFWLQHWVLWAGVKGFSLRIWDWSTHLCLYLKMALQILLIFVLLIRFRSSIRTSQSLIVLTRIVSI